MQSTSVEQLETELLKCKHPKTGCDAEQLRKEGNRHFCQKDLWKALEIYSHSVMFAPRASEGLALAYGNRSAVLFELGYPEECLRDIDRCFHTGKFPETSIHKLLSRRLKCLAKLNHNGKLKADIERLTDYLSKCNLENEKKGKVLEEAEAILSKSCNHRKKRNGQRKPPQLFLGSNNRIPNLSFAFHIEHNDELGRFIVADRQISPGSVAIVERSYSAVLLPHAYDTYCHHCQKVLPLDVVPCAECSQVRYCGELCRDLSWSMYHWLECGYLDILHQLRVGHLALRILLVTELKQVITHLWCPHKGIPTLSNVYGMSERNEVYRSDYDALFHLVAHEDGFNAEDKESFQLAARLLVSMLKWKDYFGRLEPFRKLGTSHLCDACLQRSSVYEASIETLLLRHIHQMCCNAIAITQVVSPGSPSSKLLMTPPPPFPSSENQQGGIGNPGSPLNGGINGMATVDTTEQVRIATAIYPVGSLIGHSCDPNAFISFVGNALVVRAVKNVPLGAELQICYGPHVGRMLVEERREVLRQQYCFDCKCLACCDNSSKELTYSAFKCQSCSGPVTLQPDSDEGVCLDCKKAQECLAPEVDRVLEKVMDSYAGASAKTVHYAVCKLEQVLYRHNRKLSAARDYVARLLAEQCYYADSERILLRNLETVAYYYGEQSVELANELQKIMDVQVAMLEQSLPDGKNIPALLKKLQKHVDSASAIFAVYYGTDCSQIEELSRLKQVIRFTSGMDGTS